MSDRPIVILHGWNDISNSFEPLANLLRAKLNGRQISVIHLADYLSMEDEIRFDDIVSAMAMAWERTGLPTNVGSVDAIVHSTGGLVIRDWLQRNYDPNDAPIKHLVMLAPANFGSPLAHKGRSLAGRIWKGLIAKKPTGRAFQTGTHILKGLELASPYTWDLAERDRFGDGGKMYGPGNVLCTVLVGQNANDALSTLAKEDGWDGTVRVATANLDCARMSVVVPADPGEDDPVVVHQPELSSGLTAFGVLDRHDHGSIKLTQTNGQSLSYVEQTRKNGSLFSDIVTALTVTDREFERWRTELSVRNRELRERAERTRNPKKHGYQNTVIRVQDQYGVGVEDFVIEFYEENVDKIQFSIKTHRNAFRNAHAYSDDRSYRSFYIDQTSLRQNVDKANEFLGVSISAYPEIDNGAPVGFAPYGQNGRNGFRIRESELDNFFVPNRTLLLALQLTRQQSATVFQLRQV